MIALLRRPWLRILIADDEAGARHKVKLFLEAHEDCECVAEAENGRVAVAKIVEMRPDLVFLDINMPYLDGFEVVAQLPQDYQPMVIFATAYSDRAIQAFEVCAVDYLLKPFDRRRFDAALERARQRWPQRDQAYGRVLQALASLTEKSKYPGQILVQGESSVKVVATDTIDYVESAGNYAVLHASDQDHVVRQTIRHLESLLNPGQFCRIHRQYLVRVAVIAEIQPYHKGDMLVVLRSGKSLKMSRRYKDNLMSRMIR